MNWLKLPKKVYFKKGSTAVAIKELRDIYNVKHALIITDGNLYRTDIVTNVDRLIRALGIRTAQFFTGEAQPTIADAYSGLPKMLEFQPDAIVAVGGGSVISLAKVMHLLYEHPDVDLKAVIEKHGSQEDPEVDKAFPVLGQKAKLFTIATTGGSGAECSPFAVIKDKEADKLCTIAASAFIPEMAVIDADHSLNLSADVTRSSGLGAFTLAMRALLAPDTSEYVAGFVKDAVKNVFAYLPAACSEGAANPAARIKMSDAAALAGMAYGNACPSLDPAAPLYPADADKDAASLNEAQLAAIADLAGDCGLDLDDCKNNKDVFKKWIAACEALLADLDD